MKRDKGTKRLVLRHGDACKRSLNAEEKAIETRNRQAAKREIRKAQLPSV